MLRAINNTRISDKISVALMLEKLQLLSVNQLAAQIKLQEVGKSADVESYPKCLEPYNQHQGESGHLLRTRTNIIFNDSSQLQVAQHSFNIDAVRLWNSAPVEITSATSFYATKKAILQYSKTLPF